MPLSTCEILFNLIPTLQVELLVRWLTAKDVGRLDTALCASGHREPFLKILDEEHCIFEHTSRDIYGHYLSWIIDKHIRISDAKIPRSFGSVQQSKLFQTTGKYLRKLDAPDWMGFGQTHNNSRMLLELFTMCINLEELTFTGSDLAKADICSILHHFPRLRHLNLSHCRNVTGEMIVRINHTARSLESLILSDCSIVDDIPAGELITHSKIHTIEVLNIGRLDRLVPLILQCNSLRVLHVENIQLADLLLILTECTKIRSLSAALKTSPHLTATEFDTLVAHMRHLEILQLYLPQWEGPWTPLFDEQLQYIVNHCPHLRMLLASHIPTRYMRPSYGFALAEMVYDVHNGVINVQKKSQLQTLVVGSVQDNTLQNILAYCPNLTTFKIDSPLGAIFRDLCTIIGNSSVKTVKIGSCQGIVRVDILQLLNMTAISLTDTELQHTDIVSLIDRNPHLIRLCLLNCPYLTHDTLLYIVEKCTHLEELQFSNIDATELYDRSINSDLMLKFVKLHRPKLQKVIIQLRS